LVRCLFLLYSLFLCDAYAAEASFDKKGLLEAVQLVSRILTIHIFFKFRYLNFPRFIDDMYIAFSGHKNVQVGYL
jgi:hypothetical protein